MPKSNQPRTLVKLAIETLGKTVSQKVKEAIGSGTKMNMSDLHDCLYAELPVEISREITAHMLTEVVGGLSNYENCGNTNLNDIIIAIVCHDIRVLDLSKVPVYAREILSCNIEKFKKLQTLEFKDCLPTYVTQTVPAGLSLLKCLVKFRMQYLCNDDIIQALGSSCSATIQHVDVNYSEEVTDSSLEILLKCRKLKHVFIADTSVTAEGFVQFLQRDDTAKGFLGVAVGSEHGWDVSSTHLNEIALCCPMLKQLEISRLRGDMEALVSLTTLEVLRVHDCEFDESNFDGFLRVRGSNIISLCLDYTECIDYTCIMNHCVNIRRLCAINSCVGDDSPLVNVMAFQNLEKLVLCWLFFPSSLEGMLYACVNITRLYLYACKESITDQLILRVLCKNPLQKLSKFRAAAQELTMRSVNAIIEQCPLLEELMCYECRAITEAEVNILRQTIVNKNQDLRIGFTFRKEM